MSGEEWLGALGRTGGEKQKATWGLERGAFRAPERVGGLGHAVLAVSLLLGACSTEADDADGCACSASGDRRRTMSLACYCQELGCPTYEEAQAQGLGSCSAQTWTATRQEGCGQILIGSDGGLGGSTFVFDATSHELLGVSSYSDTSLDSCGNFAVVAGVAPACSEGRICARCASDDEACEDACSVAALARHPPGGGYRFDQAVQLQGCVGLTDGERPRRTTGCGRVTVQLGHTVVVFDEQTQELLGVQSSGAFAESVACAGQWGEAELACAAETSCSQCQEDAARCEV